MRRISFLLILLLLLPYLLEASVLEVRRSAEGAPDTLDVTARQVRLSVLISALTLHLRRPVQLAPGVDRQVDVRFRGVSARRALEMLVEREDLKIVSRGGVDLILDRTEPVVDLDVEDGEVRSIVQVVASQCGIHNVMIDPAVSGRGTFRFRDVPCHHALDVVLRSLGIEGTLEPNSVLVVK